MKANSPPFWRSQSSADPPPILKPLVEGIKETTPSCHVLMHCLVTSASTSPHRAPASFAAVSTEKSLINDINGLLLEGGGDLVGSRLLPLLVLWSVLCVCAGQ